MSNDLFISPLASEDIENIYDYIYRESRSRRIANAMIARINATARNFATQPNAGADSSHWLSGSRYFVVRSYVIVYRPLPNGIEIVRVLHGMMDLRRFFPGGDA
jgi:toxin ParE1/3/4